MEGSTLTTVSETHRIIKALRQELKQWETSFFAAHKRKAERQDIKQHPEIEQKYKTYNDLRYPSSKPACTETTTPSKKRHHASSSCAPPTSTTPSKRPKIVRNLHPAAIDPYDPPISAHPSPITHRTAIGPTPQKDGMVLGLFDGLCSGSQRRTPSKRRSLLAGAGNVEATPSKRRSVQTEEEQVMSTGKRHRKSPMSTLKNAEQNIFLTPSARRIVDSKSTPGSRTGVSRLCFDETPHFLRRHSQRALTGKENADVEGDISWSPVATRILPKAFAGKGLSALVKGLRNMEDERLEEELEVLRELEGGDPRQNANQQESILVKDSQRSDMPLGPDGGLESDGKDDYLDEEKGRNGRSLKVWKKKGQKRTTRKVVMKPTTAKWKPEPTWKGESESEDEIRVASIANPQFVSEWPRDVDQIFDKEEHDKEEAATEDTSKGKRTGKGESLTTKVKKKISATAHANFRALTIKNKQSKGKGRGSFRRKRQ